MSVINGSLEGFSNANRRVRRDGRRREVTRPLIITKLKQMFSEENVRSLKRDRPGDAWGLSAYGDTVTTPASTPAGVNLRSPTVHLLSPAACPPVVARAFTPSRHFVHFHERLPTS